MMLTVMVIPPSMVVTIITIGVFLLFGFFLALGEWTMGEGTLDFWNWYMNSITLIGKIVFIFPALLIMLPWVTVYVIVWIFTKLFVKESRY